MTDSCRQFLLLEKASLLAAGSREEGKCMTILCRFASNVSPTHSSIHGHTIKGNGQDRAFALHIHINSNDSTIRVNSMAISRRSSVYQSLDEQHIVEPSRDISTRQNLVSQICIPIGNLRNLASENVRCQ